MMRLVAALVLAAAPAWAVDQSFSTVERGKYLADVGDCVACHTVPGGAPYAGGRAIETPFGKLVSPNLTPDRETGIGSWTDDQFARAVQKGIGRGGEHLYPALPYAYYTKAPRDDVLAIRAYLLTLAPVRNEVKSNQLPFPFDVRESVAAWNRLYFTEGERKPDPAKSAEWNRGAMLVEGLGHCGACHTPKSSLGGDDAGRAFQGFSLQGWYAPNLTNDARTGLGGWSAEDVVEYLRDGRNRFAIASGPMSEVVSYSTSRMTGADLQAIAVYLKELPGQAAGAAVAKPGAAAEALYVDNCAACHTGSGAGVARLFPALAGAPAIQSREATSLIRVVLQGAQGVATDRAPTGPAMPAFGWKLDDGQVAAVVSYVRGSWGNSAAVVTAGEVAKARADLAKRTE